MSIASAIRQLVERGFTMEQALMAAEIFESEALTPSDVRSPAAKRQAKYRERKASQSVTQHNESDASIITERNVNVTDVTPVATPLVRAFSIGEEEEDTPSLRSGAAGAAEGVTPVPAKPDYPIDPTERLWSEGVDMLTAMGAGDRPARGNIGRWLKFARGDPGTVLDAIRLARDRGTRDPIALVTRIISPAKTPQSEEKSVHAAAQRLCEDVASGAISFGPPPEPYVLALRREREREAPAGLLPEG